MSSPVVLPTLVPSVTALSSLPAGTPHSKTALTSIFLLGENSPVSQILTDLVSPRAPSRRRSRRPTWPKPLLGPQTRVAAAATAILTNHPSAIRPSPQRDWGLPLDEPYSNASTTLPRNHLLLVLPSLGHIYGWIKQSSFPKVTLIDPS